MGLPPLVVALLASCGAALLLAAFSVLSPPAWREEVKGDWKKINGIAALIAAASGGVSAATWASLPSLPLAAIAVSTACLMFASLQAAVTDPQLRLVDRRMLYVAMLPPLVLHFLLMKDQGLPFTIWLIFIMVSAALIFLPGLMGASDGRALLLVAIAAFPPLGTKYFVWGFAGFILLALLYSVWKARAEATSSKPLQFLKAIVAKRSVPAVPMIILPFAVLLPLVGLLSL